VTQPAKARIRALLPTVEVLLNHVVNRIPYASARMRAYALLGLGLEDPSTGVIMLGTEIHSPRLIRIGPHTAIGSHCLLDARGGITIARSVNISSHVKLQTAKHLIQTPDFAHVFEPIAIGDRAWLALGVTVLGGVSVGEGAVVAAGSVVTRDVQPFTVVGGIPARPIGERRSDLSYDLDWRPNWQ
jgi:putative colanic acid biosynthesis acetyltransferase WcaF